MKKEILGNSSIHLFIYDLPILQLVGIFSKPNYQDR